MEITKPIKVVKKSWGEEIWIHNSSKYCGKILKIYKNKKSSFHYHKIKDETFYLQDGKVSITTINEKDETKSLLMNKGDILEIPKGIKHQFIGIAEISEIFEVSTQHFDEDSIREKI